MYLLETQPIDDGLGGLLFVAGLLALVAVFCIFMAVKTSKARKAAKANFENNLKSQNAHFMVQLKHFNGLPLAEGVLTQCFWCYGKAVFEANGASFNLDLSKITDISIKTDVEIQKQYVSSVGGAVAGAAVFGPIGAMIGGRAKQKKTKQVTQYLIFTYVDNDELKYIAFDCTGVFKAADFVKEFQKLKPAQPQSFDL